MDAPNPETPVSKPPSAEEAVPFDGAVAVWDFWLRRLYLEELTEMDRQSLD
jgi:hypothetical protein